MIRQCIPDCGPATENARDPKLLYGELEELTVDDFWQIADAGDQELWKLAHSSRRGKALRYIKLGGWRPLSPMTLYKLSQRRVALLAVRSTTHAYFATDRPS